MVGRRHLKVGGLSSPVVDEATELGEELFGPTPQCARDLDRLDDVETPLPTLHLHDVVVGPAEDGGELPLAEPRLRAPPRNQCSERVVLVSLERLA